MSAKKYKVGDVVFVVPLLTRQQRQNGYRRQGRPARITKVGRRWVHTACDSKPFDVYTLRSRDDSGIDRYEGYGYDVFASREEWERHEADEMERESLRQRLADFSGRFILSEITLDQVRRITAILDEVPT